MISSTAKVTGTLFGLIALSSLGISKAKEPPTRSESAPPITIDIGTAALGIRFGQDSKTLQIAAPAQWKKDTAAALGGKLLRIDLATRKVQTLIPDIGQVAVGWTALAPDGRSIMSAVGAPSGFAYHVEVWNTLTAKSTFALPEVDNSDWTKTQLLGENFTADGAQLLTFQRNGLAEIWDVKQKKRLVRIHLQGGTVFENALLSPNGRQIAYAGEDSVLRLYDVQSGRTRELDANCSCHRLAFSPDGALLAVAANQGIDLWSMPVGKKLRTLTGSSGFLSSLAFNRDGSLLAGGTIQTGSKDPNWRGSVALWKVTDSRPMKTIGGFTESIMGLALSPDGKLLATGSFYEPVVRVWALKP